MITDKQYIEVYDKIGHKYFCKGSDNKLREWGNSEEKIRQIKINCVKHDLEWSKQGINTYKLLNELCGGNNII